jgi:hypothetical protein
VIERREKKKKKPKKDVDDGSEGVAEPKIPSSKRKKAHEVAMETIVK